MEQVEGQFLAPLVADEDDDGYSKNVEQVDEWEAEDEDGGFFPEFVADYEGYEGGEDEEADEAVYS